MCREQASSWYSPSTHSWVIIPSNISDPDIQMWARVAASAGCSVAYVRQRTGPACVADGRAGCLRSTCFCRPDPDRVPPDWWLPYSTSWCAVCGSHTLGCHSSHPVRRAMPPRMRCLSARGLSTLQTDTDRQGGEVSVAHTCTFSGCWPVRMTHRLWAHSSLQAY